MVVMLIALGVASCREASSPSAPASPPPTPKTYGKFDWLPIAAPVSAPQIPKDAQFAIQIPADDPLKGRSTGWGSAIDTNGNVTPKEKKDYAVSGSLVTRLGPLEKRAKYGDWDFVYQGSIQHQINF